MFNITRTHLIQFPSGRWGYVGLLPLALGTELAATKSDVLGGRAYRNAAGELVAPKFPSFATAAEAIEFAASKGVEVVS